jgi:phospholipase C
VRGPVLRAGVLSLATAASPRIDQFGPGTRVPMIIASPYAKAGFVDYTRYETDSILALVEQHWGLSALGTRDAGAAPVLDAFDFSQTPLACQPS